MSAIDICLYGILACSLLAGVLSAPDTAAAKRRESRQLSGRQFGAALFRVLFLGGYIWFAFLTGYWQFAVMVLAGVIVVATARGAVTR